MPELSDLLQDLQRTIGERLSAIEDSIKNRAFLSDGLFSGIESVQATQFAVRYLRQDREEKQSLAEYFLRTAVAGSRGSSVEASSLAPDAVKDKKVFIESGSTFGPLIGGFARAIEPALLEASNEKPNVSVPFGMEARTNSILALNTWANLIRDVVVAPGTFLAKYYGLFPFSDSAQLVKWDREAEYFAVVRREVSECDRVFATCSTFSLLAGPIVGSRANAVFKHAMYSNVQEGQDFVLVFAFPKLISLLQGTTPRDAKDTCYCVLDRPKWASSASKSPSWNTWHTKWLARETGVLPSVGPLFEQGVEEFNVRRPLSWSTFNFSARWLDVARNVTVVVGLGQSSGRYAALKKEVDACNGILKQHPGSPTVVVSDESLAKTYGVAVMKYVSP